jgi:homoserine kinase
MQARRGASVATAFAPASVGNVGVGFDILGHALAGAGDRVVARKTARPGVRIAAIRGAAVELPREAERNTAGKALLSLLAARRADFGVEIEIEKGIALGSGMGGSAASAVAALVAANELFEQPLDREGLYAHALEGEAVASGGKHGDNIAPMLLGGLVLATRERMVEVPVPRGLWCALAHPHFVLETRVARAALKDPYSIGDFTRQSERLALVLAGCWRDDLSLVRAGLEDVLVEPRRAPLIPGFAAVKQAALSAGALGASISGAGPSVFAWCEGEAAARRAASAMQAAFAAAGLESDPLACPVDAPGAVVESRS